MDCLGDTGLNFNLSENKSLRTLEIEARTVSGASGFFKSVLSTIPPLLPLEVVIIYTEFEVGYPMNNTMRGPIHTNCFCAKKQESQQGRFRVFYEMRSVREFQLVLRAEVLERAEEHAMTTLNRVVEEQEQEYGLLNYLQRRPLVTSQISAAEWAGVHLQPIPGRCNIWDCEKYSKAATL